MNNMELLESVIKIVKHLNDTDNDAFDITLTAPDGGKLKCHFYFEVELPEGHHDD